MTLIKQGSFESILLLKYPPLGGGQKSKQHEVNDSHADN